MGVPGQIRFAGNAARLLRGDAVDAIYDRDPWLRRTTKLQPARLAINSAASRGLASNPARRRVGLERKAGATLTIAHNLPNTCMLLATPCWRQRRGLATAPGQGTGILPTNEEGSSTAAQKERTSQAWISISNLPDRPWAMTPTCAPPRTCYRPRTPAAIASATPVFALALPPEHEYNGSRY